MAENNREQEYIQFHPIAGIFPKLETEKLSALAEDIRSNGLRDPIWIFEGKVLDGRNRLTACRLAGVEPKTREFIGSRSEALAFVWSLNFQRRHLNSSQAAIAEAERAKLDSEYAADLEASRKAASKGGRPKKDEKPSQIIATVSRDDRSINSKRAEAAGTNRTYVKAADSIVAQHPELATRIKAGELTIPQAKSEIKRQEKLQALNELADQAKALEADRPVWTIMNVDVEVGLQSVTDEWGPVDLIFADPPYNIGVDYGDGEDADKLHDGDYMRWVSIWLSQCEACLSPTGSMWVMIGDEYAAEYAIELKDLGLTIRSWVKWYETFGVNCSNKFNRTSRHLFYCVKDPKRFTFNTDAVTRPSDRQSKYGDKRAAAGGKIWDDVWQIPRLTGTCLERIPDFPTQLPLSLVRPIVECCSNPGDLVVDPFCGSGTTGVAAITSGRKFVGIELQERFVDLAQKRLVTA